MLIKYRFFMLTGGACLMRYVKNSYIKKFFETDVTRMIFDNIRNFMYCALFLAMGTQAVMSPSETLGLYDVGVVFSGWLFIVISLVLMLLTILDGIHKLSKVGVHAYIYPFIILIYFLTVMRLVMFIWSYRLNAMAVF